jgi:hypothetical protein
MCKDPFQEFRDSLPHLVTSDQNSIDAAKSPDIHAQFQELELQIRTREAARLRASELKSQDLQQKLDEERADKSRIEAKFRNTKKQLTELNEASTNYQQMIDFQIKQFEKALEKWTHENDSGAGSSLFFLLRRL